MGRLHWLGGVVGELNFRKTNILGTLFEGWNRGGGSLLPEAGENCQRSFFGVLSGDSGDRRSVMT